MYQRLVAYLAGPLSAGIGLLSTAVMHQTVSKSVALNTATFILTSGATALGHIKWLNNVPKWWEHERAVNPQLTQTAEGLGKAVLPQVKADVDRWFAELDAANAKAQEIQNAPGTPADQVTAGLAPTSVEGNQIVAPQQQVPPPPAG